MHFYAKKCFSNSGPCPYPWSLRLLLFPRPTSMGTAHAAHGAVTELKACSNGGRIKWGQQLRHRLMAAAASTQRHGKQVRGANNSTGWEGFSVQATRAVKGWCQSAATLRQSPLGSVPAAAGADLAAAHAARAAERAAAADLARARGRTPHAAACRDGQQAAAARGGCGLLQRGAAGRRLGRRLAGRLRRPQAAAAAQAGRLAKAGPRRQAAAGVQRGS